MNKLNEQELLAQKIYYMYLNSGSKKTGINAAAKQVWEVAGLTRDAAQHKSRKFYHSRKWETESHKDARLQNEALTDLVKDNVDFSKPVPAQVETEYFENEPKNEYTFTKFIPVSIKLDKKEIKKTDSSHLKRAVILPDIQAGFRRDWRTGKMVPMHDRQCLDLALQIIEDIQPHHVVYNGDNLDLAEQSLKFAKSPDFVRTTQAAAVELAWHYAKVRQTCGDETKIDVIAGNHDERMQIAINTLLPSISELRPVNDLNGTPLTSMERFLGLSDIDVSYHGPYPYGKVWINDNLAVHHGTIVRSKSGATVSAVSDSLRHSESFGHVHRMELATRTVWEKEGPKQYMAFSAGCLCKLDPGAVPATTPFNNWQNGIAIVDYEEGNGMFHVDLILFANNKALYRGKIYTARSESDIVKDLENDTGWNFFYNEK